MQWLKLAELIESNGNAADVISFIPRFYDSYKHRQDGISFKQVSKNSKNVVHTLFYIFKTCKGHQTTSDVICECSLNENDSFLFPAGSEQKLVH